MSWETIFVLAALGGVFGFGRDLVGAWRNRKKRLGLEESRAIREPIEVQAEVLDGAAKAIAVQSAAMAELRTTVAAQSRTIAELNVKLDATAEREQKLLLLIGRMRSEAAD